MKKIQRLLAAGAATVVVLGCSTPVPPSASAGHPGETKASAIEVCMPPGERQYLSRLQCSDGSSPSFHRLGSYGPRTDTEGLPEAQREELLRRSLSRQSLRPGDPDTHIIDGYELACGDVKRVVYLDMYHCEQPPPDVAPSGFQLKK